MAADRSSVVTLNWYGPGKFDFGAGWGRERSEFILPVSPDLAIATPIGSKERGTFYATPEQTRELQQIVVTRALRWVFVRRPAPWIAKFRPRVLDAQAFEAEREAWRTWNDMHLGTEAEFRELRPHPGDAKGDLGPS
jgi:hypothetical protein